MSYLEELLPEFRKGATIKKKKIGMKAVIFIIKMVLFMTNTINLFITFQPNLFRRTVGNFTKNQSLTGNISLTTSAFVSFGIKKAAKF